MASDVLVFDDYSSVADLANFISRAKAIEEDGALLVARGTALAVYVPVLVPAELGDGGYTVLGMRVHRLAGPAEANQAYSLSALQDRLARMQPDGVQLAVPPVEEHPAWAGISVPVSGWSEAGSISSQVLRQAAQDGIDAVAQALPENPGKPVIAQIRQRIWSSPLPEAGLELPLGAAFAMHALGFLGQGHCKVFTQGQWTRVSSTTGHVVLRRQSLLG